MFPTHMRRVVEVDAELLQRSAVVTPRGMPVRCHLEIDALSSSRRRCERSPAWHQSGDERNKKQRTHPHDARHHLGIQGDRTAQRVCTTPEGVPCRALRGNNPRDGNSQQDVVRWQDRRTQKKKNNQTTDRLNEPRLCEAFPLS